LFFVWSGKAEATNEAMERDCLQAISCKEEQKPAKQD